MNVEPDPLRGLVPCELIEPNPLSNQFRILVIDDEPTNRLILNRLLGAVGYAVSEAENGASGLAQVIARRFDLVIVDMEMPILNGSETIAAIRKLPSATQRSIPIIAASGNPTDEMASSALDNGADVWMTKPFDFGKLQKSIAHLLASRRRPTSASSLRETQVVKLRPTHKPINDTFSS